MLFFQCQEHPRFAPDRMKVMLSARYRANSYDIVMLRLNQGKTSRLAAAPSRFNDSIPSGRQSSITIYISGNGSFLLSVTVTPSLSPHAIVFYPFALKPEKNGDTRPTARHTRQKEKRVKQKPADKAALKHRIRKTAAVIKLI